MKTAWCLVVVVGGQQLSQDAGICWLLIRLPRGPSDLLHTGILRQKLFQEDTGIPVHLKSGWLVPS